MEDMIVMARRPDLLERIFSDPDAAEKLRLADHYINQKRRIGRAFVLPHEHLELQPIIEKYARSFPKFVQFVKDVRDSATPKREVYVPLHELYRTLEVRLVQQQRRERANRALQWLEENYPKLNYEQKVKWIRKLEQQWAKRRMQYLDVERRKTAKNRLSTEEREELLKEFWAGIDNEIAKGELPNP